MRIDATRTAYAVYSGAEQPPLGAHSVCFVPPRTQAHAVTRDSRNRARRKRKVRSPQQREEDRYNLYLKLGDYRSASRTPDTFTRGPSPSNTTNNHFQLGFMTQDAGAASSTYWTPGPCTAGRCVPQLWERHWTQICTGTALSDVNYYVGIERPQNRLL